jgi:acyl transferase domain-containing protein
MMEDTSDSIRDALAFEPIAIIGMSSKFAGDATNNENLWKMLVDGKSGWKPFPTSRFGSEGIYHPNNEKINSVSTQ